MGVPARRSRLERTARPEFGHDEWRARTDIPDTHALDAIGRLPGAQPVANKSVRGHRLPPDTVLDEYAGITDALAELVETIDSYA